MLILSKCLFSHLLLPIAQHSLKNETEDVISNAKAVKLRSASRANC